MRLVESICDDVSASDTCRLPAVSEVSSSPDCDARSLL